MDQNNVAASQQLPVAPEPGSEEAVIVGTGSTQRTTNHQQGIQAQPSVNLNEIETTPDEEVIQLGRLKSVVWQHFTKVRVKGVIKAKCNYCKKLLGCESGNGTSHLKSHVKTCMQRRIQEGKQKVLGPNFVAKGKREMVASQFDDEVSRNELVVALVMHEYPLSMVDHLYFKRFVCSLQPLFSVPSRNTIKKDIFKIYTSEKSRIQKFIDNNKGRIAITTDMWTASNQKKGYMVVTTHYIDNSWALRSHILRYDV
ncbi:unnamed protein product [Linum trigynum]|uniref:BED-type domain-containing protein n=1 Tax=Linum trigynum TaxID=586398 RepID=A0AAV2CKP7_9ROSI